MTASNMLITAELRDRFSAKIMPDMNRGCWLWTAHIERGGYGLFGIGGSGNMASAHRVAWRLYKGEIPIGMNVLHKCDVRSCVNPDHLFLGTQADNVADRNTKGRQARGEASGRAKLTSEQVIEIRALRGIMLQREIAAAFGISSVQVGFIHRKESWRHL